MINFKKRLSRINAKRSSEKECSLGLSMAKVFVYIKGTAKLEIIKLLTVLLSALLLVSCGTIKSMDINENKVGITHYYGTTKCDEISRVYSGVRYDLCILHSDRKNVPLKFQLDPLWVTSIDVVLSAIADTIILPYTIYQQSINGNLEVTK